MISYNTYLPYGYSSASDTVYNQYLVQAESSRLPLNLDEVKEYLRIDPCDKSQDNQLQLMIMAVAEYAQLYMNRILLETEFLTYRNGFPPCISLRKSPFINLISFEYVSNGVVTEVDPTIYQITNSNDYVKIVLLPNNQWPMTDCQQQSVIIRFTAGYGTKEKDIPSALRIAMLSHVASLDSNRGDCDCGAAEAALPPTTKKVYEMYKVKNITGFEPCI